MTMCCISGHWSRYIKTDAVLEHTCFIKRNCLQAVFEKVLVPLIVMLETGDEQGRELCALAVHHLAVTGTACGKISAGGAIQPLLQLLSNGALGGKAAAANAVASLASDRETRVRILAENASGGAIQLLLRCFDAQPPSRGLQWAAARALTSLAAEDAEARRQVFAEETIGPLVRLLGEDSGEVGGDQAGAASLGSAEDIAEFLKGDGCQARLLAYLEEEPYEDQRLSALVWEGLAQLPAVQGLLLSPEALAPVVGGLKGRTPALAEALARGVGFLAEAGEGPVAELRGRGVIPPLVRLLEGKPHCGKCAAVSALAQLLSNSGAPIEGELIDEGVLKPLRTLLEQGPDDAKEAAAVLCEKLALTGDEARDRMADAGGVLKALLDVVRKVTTPAAAKEPAARALVALMQSTASAEMLVEAGGVGAFAAVVRHGPDPVATLAVGALDSLASWNGGIGTELVDQGCLAPLVKLLEGSVPSAKRCITLALESIAEGKFSAASVADEVGDVFVPNNKLTLLMAGDSQLLDVQQWSCRQTRPIEFEFFSKSMLSRLHEISSYSCW